MYYNENTNLFLGNNKSYIFMVTMYPDKIKLISDKVKELINNYILNLSKSDIFNKVINLYEKLPIDVEVKRYDKGSFILPLEDPREYPSVSGLNDTRDAVMFLERNKIAIGSFDSSYYTLGSHLTATLSIFSIAFWIFNYGTKVFDNNVKVFGDMYVGDNIDLQIKVKKCEREIIRDMINRLNGDYKIILFDESFNCAYTLSWAYNKREEMVNNVIENIELCIENGVIPVAVFYTRSKDLLRGISIYYRNHIDSEISITDATFFSKYLRDDYSRSSLFKVYSQAIEKRDINLVTYYLKVNGSVIRVEFPGRFKALINIIHEALVSQIILGDGFPLAIQRAHELAVIKKEHREMIEYIIARYLGKPGIEYLLSRKELSKRRPIS